MNSASIGRENAPMDRRRFLSQCAAGAAAAALSLGFDARGSAAEGCWKMRLSASTIGFSSLPIEEACRRIARLGFEAVDIWSAHAGCPHLDDVLARLGPDGLRQVLADNGLKLYAFSVYVGGYRKYAELLARSGGGVAVRGSSGAVDPKELASRMKAFLEGLKADADLAGENDSYLAIENHGGALLSSPDSFKAFVDLNTHPRLGIALAPYHLQAAGISVEEAIAVAGKQLLFFYAWQHAAGTGQFPGIGPTDCTGWISALAKADYPWYVNPFMHHEPEPDQMSDVLGKSRDYLKQCHAKVISQ